MTEPGRILTVCTGNVCRSPYLERRLQMELESRWGVGAIEVSSAGTGALVGAPMDVSSAELLASHGGTSGDFVARQVSAQIIADHQLVIVVSREHRTAITRLHPKALARTHALLDLAQLSQQVTDDELSALPQDPREHLEVAVKLVAAKRGLVPPLDVDAAEVRDPFRQDRAAFALMQTQIEDALPHVLRVLEPTSA